ncbi:MAG: tetratricopeptide (TPR) repeat protein [Kiritimatiellia bacterium]|jgi:tetratricopeptide (TPR) repeat protein
MPWRWLILLVFGLIHVSRANMIIFPDEAPEATHAPAVSPPEFMTARVALGDVVLNLEMAAKLLGDADTAFQEGAYKHAAELLRRLAKMMPEQADILILRARAEIGLQNYAAAEALARRASELDPTPTAPIKILGFCAMRESRWREAIEYYRTVTRMDPADASAYQAMGMLHRHLGEISEAEGLFRAGAEADPGYYFSLSSLGSLLVVQYELEEAMSVLVNTLRVDHTHERDWQNLLAAIEVRLAVKDQDPDGVPPLDIEPHRWNYQRAMKVLAAGRAAEALGYFVKALRDELNQASYHHDMGSTLAVMGRPDVALPFLQAALELDPESLTAKQNLEQVTLALRKRSLSRALVLARERVEAEPENDRYRYQLGVRYAEQGMLKEAVSALIQAVKRAPEHHAYRIALAQALARMGRMDNAIQQLDVVLQREPGDREVVHRRAWLNLHREQVTPAEIEQAVQALTALCEANQYEHPAYVQTLALAYRRQGDTVNEARVRERLFSKKSP